MKIKYVGLKPFEDAFRAETGVTWGPGVEHDIQDAAVAARMLKHPDVFALGESAKEPAAPDAQKVGTDETSDTPDTEQVEPPEGDKGPSAKFVMQTQSGPLVLDDLDKATLKALAKEADVAVGNSGPDKIRAKLAEAFPVNG